MKNTNLKQKISEIVQSFNASCEEQHHAILKQREKEQKAEEEKAKHRENVIKKFNDTILKDLQSLFAEIQSAFSSPYVDVVLDSRSQRGRFYIFDDEEVPAFAAFAVDARSKVDDDETFGCSPYLFFVASNSGDSFELSLNNEIRQLLCFGEHQNDDTNLLQTYSYDDYDFDEIRGYIEKYLTDELSYMQENFVVSLPEWDD